MKNLPFHSPFHPAVHSNHSTPIGFVFPVRAVRFFRGLWPDRRALSGGRLPWGGLIAALLLPVFFSCEKTSDSVRNWGKRQREYRVRNMEKGQEARWERDLNISRARARELHRKIQELTRESEIQGHLSWKLARAYCEKGRYEMGIAYSRGAVKNLPPSLVQGGKFNPFEKSLPYFRAALARKSMEPDLLFDAGLCFANAARKLGWEKDRFRTAVYIFERLLARAPGEARASYQLALLFGKTSDPELRNVPRALKLLKDLIRKDEYDIASRFALAHMLAEKGEFGPSLKEYMAIQEKLRELASGKGPRRVIGGRADRDPRYIRAQKNIDQLNYCLRGDKRCPLARP